MILDFFKKIKWTRTTWYLWDFEIWGVSLKVCQLTWPITSPRLCIELPNTLYIKFVKVFYMIRWNFSLTTTASSSTPSGLEPCFIESNITCQHFAHKSTDLLQNSSKRTALILKLTTEENLSTEGLEEVKTRELKLWSRSEIKSSRCKWYVTWSFLWNWKQWLQHNLFQDR